MTLPRFPFRSDPIPFTPRAQPRNEGRAPAPAPGLPAHGTTEESPAPRTFSRHAREPDRWDRKERPGPVGAGPGVGGGDSGKDAGVQEAATGSAAAAAVAVWQPRIADEP